MHQFNAGVSSHALFLKSLMTWFGPRFLVNTGMHNGRGHGGKRAHRTTGIAAARRAARKARNRARH